MEIKINQLERNAQTGGVITVHWTVLKTQGNHTVAQYGADSFEPNPSAANFKPFNQLTEQDVQGWLTQLWGTEGIAAKELALDTQLQQLMNPPTLIGLPWAATE